MLAKILLMTVVVSLAILGGYMNKIAPEEAGPLGVLIVFMFLYVLALSALTFFIYGVAWLIRHVTVLSQKRDELRRLSLKRSYYFASVLALAPVMLIAAQSIGRASFYEFMLVIVFEVVACAYISKRWPM